MFWHFVKDRECQHEVTVRVFLGSTGTERLYGRKCKSCKALYY